MIHYAAPMKPGYARMTAVCQGLGFMVRVHGLFNNRCAHTGWQGTFCCCSVCDSGHRVQGLMSKDHDVPMHAGRGIQRCCWSWCASHADPSSTPCQTIVVPTHRAKPAVRPWWYQHTSKDLSSRFKDDSCSTRAVLVNHSTQEHTNTQAL